jgi:putative phosphoesterase
MKLLIVSDVHANWSALRRLEAESADAVVFLGDAVTYGTRPAECLEWLGRRPRWSVLGNHDEALLRGTVPRTRKEFHEAAARTLDWHRSLLGRDLSSIAAAWPPTVRFEWDGLAVYATHASPTGIDDYLDSEEAIDRATQGLGATLVLLGHTHRRVLIEKGARTILNPGSLGQPRGGQGCGSYAVITDGRISFREAPYDLDEIAADYAAAPLPEEVRKKLLATLRPSKPGGFSS